jgi:hypothetical protein
MQFVSIMSFVAQVALTSAAEEHDLQVLVRKWSIITGPCCQHNGLDLDLICQVSEFIEDISVSHMLCTPLGA